jgi:hypothetical protein
MGFIGDYVPLLDPFRYLPLGVKARFGESTENI